VTESKGCSTFTLMHVCVCVRCRVMIQCVLCCSTDTQIRAAVLCPRTRTENGPVGVNRKVSAVLCVCGFVCVCQMQCYISECALCSSAEMCCAVLCPRTRTGNGPVGVKRKVSAVFMCTWMRMCVSDAVLCFRVCALQQRRHVLCSARTRTENVPVGVSMSLCWAQMWMRVCL
jgi:hypothetical protein